MDRDDILDKDAFAATADLLESSSDGDYMKQPDGGSLPGKQGNIDSGRARAAERLHHDYFSTTRVYTQVHFQRRFRLSRPIDLALTERVEDGCPYIRQKTDCIGSVGIS